MHAALTTTFKTGRLFLFGAAVAASLGALEAQAAAPGITTTGGSAGAFNLVAQTATLNQPDGAAVYSWGYGCAQGSSPTFKPSAIGGSCGLMQVPGPTLIVNEGAVVTVTLTNNLPTAAGSTSILFPGFAVSAAAAASQPAGCKAATPVAQGVLTTEVANGCAVTYTFTASTPGTRAYYSGTQSDLQVEMGLYGAIIVLPASTAACTSDPLRAGNLAVQASHTETNYRLAPAAYDSPKSCYDREYLFQFAEMDPRIHRQAQVQVLDPTRSAACAAGAGAPGCSLEIQTTPYVPAYFLINGRSMPDDMDPNYAPQYPNQPYNGNPHMHPGELVLLRIIGQGHWQHPFHEHANHVRILARDGNFITDASGQNLAGPLLFTTTTTPGQSMDGIFYYTGRGLNWDMYGHHADAGQATPPGPADTDPNAVVPCVADVDGYYTVRSGAPASAINYYEWCQDHNKPLEVTPLGDVAAGGPATLPDPNILTNGAWYSGSPYLGPDATTRATGPTSVYQPANVQANPANERAYAFMWHSHNEREITTNNVFPGGMFMMMLVDSREFVINEAN